MERQLDVIKEPEPNQDIKASCWKLACQPELLAEAATARDQTTAPPCSRVPSEGGGKEKDDGEVEMEAYGQGALKTELCNKWEHSVCPYDGRCRFAHGLEELCPVICHPRCKTLACQLFASG
ncbi:putative zinc finger CCCH domain-containing protein 21 isoform X2 [Panicum virgatum]|uniref:putative zinc finger CCCH domain-containing protein 21 isoform X2 n=1 Tax=Panicum virgatum TaxID=38727 RepID=UPI0019D608C4|nr:putative zinc finger CCCH domain-containing protein 21 isoform X2 [Panicum virgatum]